jgi:hypothetical protein
VRRFNASGPAAQQFTRQTEANSSDFCAEMIFFQKRYRKKTVSKKKKEKSNRQYPKVVFVDHK